ncbi:MAG: DnaA family protein [Gammaproteobacteria bacterium]|jgi:DnaA family protein
MLGEAHPINASQIALPLSFDKQFSFENYYSEQGKFITKSLMSLINQDGESLIGVWGGADSGKSHLINACAYYARLQSKRFQLYDGHHLIGCDPEQFNDFSNSEALLIDNLDAVCGHRQWEQKFYQIINACKRGEMTLLFTLSVNPQFLDCALLDFQSRLAWGLLLQLPSLTDAAIGKVLKYRAGLLGIELSKEVITYLLTHYSRSLSEQMEILQKLDEGSLAAQKRVTIPFIKQTLV